MFKPSQRALGALIALCLSPFVASDAHAQAGSYLRSDTFTDTTKTVTVDFSSLSTDNFSFFYRDGGGTGNVAGLGTHSVSINGAQICTGAACDGAKFSPSADGSLSVQVSGTATAGQSYTFYVQCNGTFVQALAGTAAGACSATNVSVSGGSKSSGGISPGSSQSASTSTPTTKAKVAGKAAAAAGGSSAGAAGTAIGNAMASRGGGSGPVVTSSGMFFATQGQTSGTMFWSGISGRKFSGDLDGQGGEITLGADWDVGNGTVLGLALSYGKYEISSGGVDVETEALAFGPYVSTELSPGVSLEAYVMMARPDYESGGTSYSSRRVMGGVDLGLAYSLGQTQATGYLRLSGFSEDLPGAAPGGARNIKQSVASIGSRFDFAPAASVRPHMSIGADAIRFDDGTTSINSTSPHFGLGLEADAGPGTLSIDLNANEIFDDAKTVSFGLRYSASF